MSDEDEEISEGFSASEDDWQPDMTKGGESSDDDDSDFEEEPVVNTRAGRGSRNSQNRVAKGAVVKKKKPSGQSLRSKLYNKYRPPPKTLSNSPTASTSKTASKNADKPNESQDNRNDNDDGNDSSSDSSVDNYLVDPKQIDINSEFFNVASSKDPNEKDQVPTFDCNAGLKTLSDSGSEDDNESSTEDRHGAAKKETAFDFHSLLENANQLEKAKETIAKRAAENKQANLDSSANETQALDTLSLLALGENLKNNKTNQGPDDLGPSKLTKTKSTRIKRHTKTRPNSAVIKSGGTGAANNGSDSDEEEFEEVAGYDADLMDRAYKTNKDSEQLENLEIVVDFPNRQKTKKEKHQEDIENALRRRLNHEIKKKQLLKHKTSFMCLFARSFGYNKILNNTKLMQRVLKMLPSKNAYPSDKGTEVKYFQSFVTWYKTAIRIANNTQYPLKKVSSKRKGLIQDLGEQINKKEAKCWQDFVYIFVILCRGMGFQCRLIVNIQPLALRPNQSDLLTIKMKKNDDNGGGDKSKDEKQNKSEGKSSKNQSETKTNNKSGNKKDLDSSQEKKSKKPPPKSKGKGKKNISKEENSSEDDDEDDFEEVEELEEVLPRERPTRSTRKKENTQNSSLSANSSGAVEQTAEVEEEKPQRKTRATRSKALPKQSAKMEVSEKPLPKEKQMKNLKNIPATSVAIEEKPNEIEIKTKEEELSEVSLEKSEKIEMDSELSQKSLEGFKGFEENSYPECVELEKGLTALCSSKEFRSKVLQQNKKKPNLSKLKRNHSQSLLSTDEEETEKKMKSEDSSLPLNSTNNSLVNDKDFKGFSDASYLEGFSDIDNGANSTMMKMSPKIPDIKITSTSMEMKNSEKSENLVKMEKSESDRCLRSRSKSPKIKVDPSFLRSKSNQKDPIFQSDRCLRSRSVSPKMDLETKTTNNGKGLRSNSRNKNPSTAVVEEKENTNAANLRPQRSRTRANKSEASSTAKTLSIPQLDGADDGDEIPSTTKGKTSRKPQLKKLNKSRSKETENSEEEFEPSPAKRPKSAPVLPKQVEAVRRDRRVISTDNEDEDKTKKKDALDFWVEIWSEVEMQWIPIDVLKGKVNSIESIRKTTSSSLSYVFAFQNDLSIKDVTARYCPHWSTTIRKNRVDKDWLNAIVEPHLGHRTERDIREDQELRRIHEEKPLPKSIAEFKDHPLYVLERHLLKFQALYPPEPPSLGFIRGEPIYPRECVYTLHSREIWLKSARVVKPGEKPYKVVKARPKWDRMTQSVIKDQPLEIFGYWQTMDYEPPTAENGLVPRNAYGNVELFKACMLPKKTVHLRLPGLSRICKKLNIDCANAVIGFDFHQGACHPTYDGFVVCEEFADTVVAAWNEEQAEQERKDQEKYEARVYGNWKKLIRGLLIRERLKRKYNF